MKIDLNGKWLFRSSSNAEFLEGEVPGTNFQDLLRLGKMRDPFRDLSKECLDETSIIASADWTYQKTVTIDKDFLNSDKVYFVAKCIDTLAVLKVNGQEVTRLENAFIALRYNIKDYLVEGDNTIELHFCAPEGFVKSARKLCKTPHNNNGLTGIVHIRKPQYHFGWDFAPYLPVSGITSDVYLESANCAEIKEVRIEQNHFSDGQVAISITLTCENYSNKPLSVLFSLLAPNGSEYSTTGVLVDNNTFKGDITVENPELWWTHDLSDKEEQPLYELISSIFFEDEMIAGKIQKIGLRSLKLLRDTDEFGRNFCFELNGVKIFAKGANYVSPDIINSLDKERLTRTLLDVVSSNMNMLRVFGGSKYPDDFFFDECDRLGILVWQDFMFGCQGYPFFLPNFANNCIAEASYQVRRLRHHPSLALWCGNNEIEAMCPAWFYLPKYIDWAEKYFYKVLPELLKNIDDRPYIAGSPTGLDYLLGQGSDNVGDSHIWNVWHGLMPTTYYRKRNPRFCSEFGMESLPDIRTLSSYSDEDITLKSGLSLREYGANGLSKMRYYSLKNFNIPKDIYGWEYISELSSAEGIREAISHFRAIKGRCNGALIWQLNDMWPGISWSMIDYLGRFKAEMYYAKRLFKDLAVNIECTDGGFYIRYFNDTLKDYSAHLTFNVCEYDGKVIYSRESDVEIKTNESSQIMAVGMAAIREKNKHLRAYAEAILTVDGVEIATDIRLIRREKYAKLNKPEISKTLEKDDNGILKITLVSNTFARGVCLKNLVGLNNFSDNYFDLVPAKPKIVTIDVGNIDNLDGAISISDCTSFEVGKSLPANILSVAQIFRPLNFVNRLASRKVPKDIRKRFITFYDTTKKED